MARQSNQNKWLGVVLAGIAGAIALRLLWVGFIRWNMFSQAQIPPNSPSATVQDTENGLRLEVAALGRVEPQGEVLRISGPNGDRIGRLEVKQGNVVSKGKVLAYLESYAERLAERDLAASQLAEAQERLQAVTDYGEAQIETARTQLQRTVEPGGFEVEAQQATVRRLQAELEVAQQDLQRFQQLYREGVIAKQSLDQQVSRTRQVQEALNNAQSTLTQVQASWRTNVQNAEAQLGVQESNLSLTQVQVTVRSAEQNLRLAQARLDRTLIRAPRAGRVLRIFAREGEAIGNQGILDLGDTRQMYVVAEIYETDVPLVKVGQTAVIASRHGAFNKLLKGKVAEVGWQVFKNNLLNDDPAANADSRVVEVKIRLDEDSSKLVEALTNLQVDVKIKL